MFPASPSLERRHRDDGQVRIGYGHEIATVANKTELGAYPLTAATNILGIAKGSDEGMIIKTGDAGCTLVSRTEARRRWG
jgi:hypothetical protein